MTRIGDMIDKAATPEAREIIQKSLDEKKFKIIALVEELLKLPDDFFPVKQMITLKAQTRSMTAPGDNEPQLSDVRVIFDIASKAYVCKVTGKARISLAMVEKKGTPPRVLCEEIFDLKALPLGCKDFEELLEELVRHWNNGAENRQKLLSDKPEIYRKVQEIASNWRSDIRRRARR